jgi:predicted ATPase
MLPETPERSQRELTLSITLAAPLLMTRGYAASDVERVYSRIQQLCRQLGDTPQVFPALYGMCLFYLVRGEGHTARQFGQQALLLAQQLHEPDFLVLAHTVLGGVLFFGGALTTSLEHLEQGLVRYDPVQHHALVFRYGDDPGVFCHAYMSFILWMLGYPDQAHQQSNSAVALGRHHGHPFSLAIALVSAAIGHQFRWEGAAAQGWAEELMALASEQGFAHWLAEGQILHGWALAQQGHLQAGIEYLCQGLAAWRAMGAAVLQPYWLALLAEAYWWAGQLDQGLQAVAAALAVGERNGEPYWDAHLYWLKGELLLAQQGPEHTTPEVEACFHHAIAIARGQQAKSLELRAVMGLSRLWQRQGRRTEARQLLGEMSSWFTEGFETADLQEAKALLTALS